MLIKMIHALVLIGAVAATVCACKERSEPEGWPERQDVSPVGGSTAGPLQPALWEPIDKSFAGCEGG